MQEVWVGAGEGAEIVRLPPRDAEVISGVLWGSPDCFNTPAYWAVRCKWQDAIPTFTASQPSFVEELAFCLLGGFGITYEVNSAAFSRLSDAGCFDLSLRPKKEHEIRELLLKPLAIDGRSVRYRFPNQRARRLFKMRGAIEDWDFHALSAEELRRKLMTLEGVGPKTAAWIVRNCLASDEVAIIDVHLIRACSSMEIFPKDFTLPRDYEVLERRFLEFAKAIDVRPSILDAVIWTEARKTAYRRVVR